MAEVALEGVTREYSGGARVVDNVSFTIRDQELLVLVGPSGCGKSTTLRMIAGLEPLSAGQIRIGGRVVNDIPARDRDLAMVFQNYALYPHMTVRANLGFALKLRYDGGWLMRLWRRLAQPARAAEFAEQRRSIPARVVNAARVLGIEHLLGRLPGQLSGGERQRVALGRAIVRQPVAFLFDEPLSNLDARLRVEMRRELKELHQKLGATMIYVTHDQVEALTLGDRIAVMNHGVLQQIGTPEEIYDRPWNTFVASFLGSPAMNLLQGTWKEVAGEQVFESHGLLVPLGDAQSGDRTHRPADGEQVALGIRPEDIELSLAGLGVADGSNGGCPGVVTVSESLGDARLVTVRLDGGMTLGSVRDEQGSVYDSRGILQAGGAVVVARIEPRLQVKVGDRVAVRFDSQRCHLFTKEGRNFANRDS